MISIRKTATELDRLEELSRAAVSCYRQAINSVENHAIEINPSQSAQFRSQLHILNEKVKAAGSPDELKTVQALFDQELKGYQKMAQEQIERLRKDFAAAASAVEVLAKSVTSNSSGLDQDMGRQLDRLRKVAASDNLVEIRSEILVTVDKIAASIKSMNDSNQLAIAQMKDEIRLLHDQVKAARGPQPAISEAGGANGQAGNLAVAKFTAQNRPFSALLAVVENLQGLRMLYPPNTVESGLCSFEARFKSLLPGAVVERRGKHQFIAILESDPKEVIAMSRELAKKLSLPLIEEEKGVSHTLRLSAGVGVLEFMPGTDGRKFETKLDQLAEALSGSNS